MNFSAEELAEWASGKWEHLPSAEIRGFSKDSRTIEAGEVYLALKGGNFDGHAFVADAFAKGASAAVVCRDWDAGDSVEPLLRVDDPGRALCAIAGNYRKKIAPLIVGITGSAGKSTVKQLVTVMLSMKAPTVSTRGNWNNQVGLPMSMLAIEPGTVYGVFELGTNHPGEIGALCNVLNPDWGVITNTGPAHIEFFGSLEAIASEKGDLIRSLPETGCAVLNADTEFYKMLRSISSCRVVSVSMGGQSDYVCIEYNATGKASILERNSGEKFLFQSPQPGSHNIVNVMQAVAVARGQGVGWDGIAAALEKYEPLPMRWALKTIRGVTVVNDAYNANPMSMRASLKAFEEMPCEGGKWIVLGEMLELGSASEEEHVLLGEFAGRSEWSGVVFTGASREYMARGANAAGFDAGRIFTCADNAGAAEVLREKLVPGDAVLLKASRGMRLEEVVEQYSKN